MAVAFQHASRTSLQHNRPVQTAKLCSALHRVRLLALLGHLFEYVFQRTTGPSGGRPSVDSSTHSVLVLVQVFTIWAILIVLINKFVDGVTMDVDPTLITVMGEHLPSMLREMCYRSSYDCSGTVLGFCISYRTTSAYQRYWEGRVMLVDLTFNTIHTRIKQTLRLPHLGGAM